MIPLSAHLFAYSISIMVAAGLFVCSEFVPAIDEFLAKFAIMGAFKGDVPVAIFMLSIIGYLVFLVIFSGIDKENKKLYLFIRLAFVMTMVFVLLVAVTGAIEYFIS